LTGPSITIRWNAKTGNGETEKVMRSLKTDDSPVIAGMQVFHNFFRPHMGLKGKTPAEVAGIKIEGANPWVTGNSERGKGEGDES
jgi:hypothetical protein